MKIRRAEDILHQVFERLLWDPRSKAVPLRFTVSLDGLEPGDYTCQVTVLDTTSQKAAFWESPVTVRP